uniref:Uncharacterized protein n=1 Tax=Arundo donax TaxID=35708 RepID=A0A0A9H3R4_ARUDO
MTTYSMLKNSLRIFRNYFIGWKHLIQI